MTQSKNMRACRLTGWHRTDANPTTGLGYGLRIGKYRDAMIDRSWDSVTLLLHNGNRIVVELTEAFWNTCPEFRHQEIGRWMLSLGIALPWPYRDTPKFTLVNIRGDSFRVLYDTQSA